ncbi:cyclin-J-like protein [Erythrolamprus reginae]|uniref:cyclin-J-like protein n=1 Tax=Erythrolamprus reginae TaxID=121349 RepID=UPI00396CEC89
MEQPWWKGVLAADVHQTLRLKELKLPVYKARSPQIEQRHYYADLLTVLSSHCQLCPTARHLAVYLLDIFMDRYDVTLKQLYVVSIACLLLASKFEEKEDKVPKLELLNNFAYMCSLNITLTKKDLLKMELLLLESFNWNLCLPTPAHYIDYYLFASVSEGDLHKAWPITSVTKFRTIMEKYSHSFLEASLQDYVFLSFRPSLVAAACVGASRVYLEISPPWTTQLQLLTRYSWEHLIPCVELMLRKAHSKDPREETQEKDSLTLWQGLNPQTPTQVLFQQPQYHPLPQPSTVLPQFCSPIQDLCSAYRDSLQAPRSRGLSSGNSALSSYSSLQENFQPVLQTVSLQRPITMQVAISTESRHCLSLVYGSSYFSRHHSYTAGCFDG